MTERYRYECRNCGLPSVDGNDFCPCGSVAVSALPVAPSATFTRGVEAADAVQALVAAAERIGDEQSRGGIEAASIAALDAAAARVREVWTPAPATAAVAEGRVPCVVCGGDIFFNDCPTGGWWSHRQHPADGHEADPPRNLPHTLGGDDESAPPVDLAALREAVRAWRAKWGPTADWSLSSPDCERAIMVAAVKYVEAIDATPAEPVAAFRAGPGMTRGERKVLDAVRAWFEGFVDEDHVGRQHALFAALRDLYDEDDASVDETPAAAGEEVSGG